MLLALLKEAVVQRGECPLRGLQQTRRLLVRLGQHPPEGHGVPEPENEGELVAHVAGRPVTYMYTARLLAETERRAAQCSAV